MLSQDGISEIAKPNDLNLPIEFMPGHEFVQVAQPEQTHALFLSPAPGLEELAQNNYQLLSRADIPSGTADSFVCLYASALLTAKQEFHLFRKMNYLKFLAEQIRINNNFQHSNLQNKNVQQNFLQAFQEKTKNEKEKLPRNSEERLKEMQSLLKTATAIRNYIVTANLRLVVSIAKKLVDANNLLEELFAQGNVPLIRAVEIFDFERGTRFSTYATWAVRNHLYRVTGKSRRYHQKYVTGDTGYFEGCENNKADQSNSERSQNHVYGLLKSVIDKLSERDQLIVNERFGLFADHSPKTFREIGLSLGISTERVRQLLHRSLEKLQSYLEERDFEMRA